MSSKLKLIPVDWKTACAFIYLNHRHHKPPQGWKFGIGVEKNEETVGVITVGRPVSRIFDDGKTLEVTRCCTDGTKNAASMLYGAAYRAAKALGYTRIITYTLIDEPGTTLKASGWEFSHVTHGRSWSSNSRYREDKHPLCDKKMWQRSL